MCAFLLTNSTDVHVPTGELGWELYHNRADSLKLYAALRKAGERYGMTNFGTIILNTLRIEKGFKHFGTEVIKTLPEN